MNSQSNQEQRPKGGFFSRLFNNNKNDATANEISPEMTKENHQIQEKNEPEWEIVADHEMVKVPSISDRKQARISAEQRVAFFVAEETKMRKAFDEAKRYASEAEEARRAAELEAAVKVAEEKAARFADSARESAAKATSAAEIFSAAEAEYNAAESRAELSRVEEQTLRKRIEARQVELAAHQKTLLLGMTAKANAAEGCNVDKKQLAATIATQVELMNAALEEAKAQEQTAIDDERVSVGKMSAATEARIAAVKKNQQDSEVKNIQAIAENDRAQISSQQTNHQIAEITTALSAAEEEAQRSIVDETQLQQTLAAEIADLEQKCATAIAAVKAETDRIVALGIEKRQMLQEYQALVAQIESAGITAEEASTRAALEERDAIDQAESNLSRISARVEAALSGANHKRQNYLDAQKIVEENTIASVKANAIEKGITEKVQKLLAEEKDAKIAAEMAESLVRDAMIAQESADTDSALLLETAGTVLTDTVNNALRIAAEKEKARLVAESQATEAVAEARKCRELAAQAQIKLAEEEKLWLAAEEELVRVSSDAEVERVQLEQDNMQLLAEKKEKLADAQDEANRKRVELDSARLKVEFALKAVADTDQARIAAEDEEARIMTRNESTRENAVKKAEDLLAAAQSRREKAQKSLVELQSALTVQQNKAITLTEQAEQAEQTQAQTAAAAEAAVAEAATVIAQAKQELLALREEKELLRKAAQSKVVELTDEYMELVKQAAAATEAATAAEHTRATALADLEQTKRDIAAEQARVIEDGDRELNVTVSKRIAAEEQSAILKNKADAQRRLFDEAVRLADEEEAKRIAAEAEAAGKAIEVKAGLLKIKADSVHDAAKAKEEEFALLEKALAEAVAVVDKLNAEEINTRLAAAEATARLAAEGETEEKNDRARAASLAKKRNRLRQTAAQAEETMENSGRNLAAAEEQIDKSQQMQAELKRKEQTVAAEIQRRVEIANLDVEQKREKFRLLHEQALQSSEQHQLAKQERETAEVKYNRLQEQLRQLQEHLDQDLAQLNASYLPELEIGRQNSKQVAINEAQIHHVLQEADECVAVQERERRRLESKLHEQKARLADLQQSAMDELERILANADAMSKTARNKRDMYFSAQKAIEDTATLVKEKESVCQETELKIAKLTTEINAAKIAGASATKLAGNATAAREAADEGTVALLAQAEKALKTAAENSVQLITEKERIVAELERQLTQTRLELESVRIASAEAPRVAAEMVNVWLGAEDELKRINDETERTRRAAETKNNKLIADKQDEISEIEKDLDQVMALIAQYQDQSVQATADLAAVADEQNTIAQAIEILQQEYQQQIAGANEKISGDSAALAQQSVEAERDLALATEVEQQKFAAALADEQVAEAAATALNRAQDEADESMRDNEQLLTQSSAQTKSQIEEDQALCSKAMQAKTDAEAEIADAEARAVAAYEQAVELEQEYDSLIEKINGIAPKVAAAIKETEEKVGEILRERISTRIAAEEKVAKLTLEKENKRFDLEAAQRLSREAEAAFKTAMDKAARFAAEAEKARQISEGRMPVTER